MARGTPTEIEKALTFLQKKKKKKKGNKELKKN